MQASGCGSRRNQFEISRKKRIHQESSIECTKIIINYDLRAVMQNKKNENCANDVKRLPGDEKNFRIFLFFFRVHARSHDSNLLKRDSRHIRAQAASGDGGANAENISFLRFICIESACAPKLTRINSPICSLRFSHRAIRAIHSDTNDVQTAPTHY